MYCIVLYCIVLYCIVLYIAGGCTNTVKPLSMLQQLVLVSG